MQNVNKWRYPFVFIFPAAFCVLHSALFVAAAPSPAPTPPSSPPAETSRPPEDAEGFARDLVAAANVVTMYYVRPVSRPELLQTALAGLYEAAGRPVPRNLRRRIDQAEAEAGRAQAEANDNPPAPLVPALAPRRNPVLDDRPVLDLVLAVRREVGRAGDLAGEDPLHVGCRAMLRALDPYSGVVTSPEERRGVGINPDRDGFGLDVSDVVADRVAVKEVLPGGPAQRAGLRPGDEITRLCDSDGRERKLAESLDVLNGRTPLVRPEQGLLATPQPVTVSYRRAAGKGERSVTLDWGHFRPESIFGVARRDDNSWNYWLDAARKIAHLRVGNIDASTPDELQDIISRLCEDGLRGLVLDLRWCPGGSLTGSVKCAEGFLGKCDIATVRYRNRPEDVFRSTAEGKRLDYPIVVLINGESSGGAEMIAAALQDHRRAVVVGQRTRGKGNVQSVTGVGSVGLKITSGTLSRPSGKNLHRFPDSKPADDWGVRPDPGREFRVSADLSRALRTWWAELTLRPGSSAERLPLDDPLTDPQRNAAVEALTELMNRKVRAKGE
jgi:carboxyl-terminal processing protease